ncbi:hypothetical protein SUGI_0601000 [Cryptomeria japonica]|nr:hypothetical protein SUGI_0601000 [Cryptomeria japonica]
MHLKEIVRSLSFRKSRSYRQSESFVLAETLTSQSMRLTKYEVLSKSLRIEDFGMDEQQQPECYGDFKGAPKSGSFRWRSKLRSASHNVRTTTAKFNFGIFPQRQMKPADEMKEAKVKVKKRNSWLPDPTRRWPVQGW